MNLFKVSGSEGYLIPLFYFIFPKTHLLILKKKNHPTIL